MSKKSGKKKNKPVYIDDGRTIADMSGVGDGFGSRQRKEPLTMGKSKWTTYKEAVKMMVAPMLVTMGIITLAFLIVYLILVL